MTMDAMMVFFLIIYLLLAGVMIILVTACVLVGIALDVFRRM